MTRVGLAALLGGLVALGLGLALGWPAFDVLGLGLLGVTVVGLLVVLRPSPLSISREIQPARVPRGSPAIAFLTFANRGRRTIPVSIATQRLGEQRVRTVIPRLRGGERGTRAYRLPTRRRGIFTVEPVELTRRDPFELFRRSRRHAQDEQIWVRPRVLPLSALPTGQARTLEGPSSELSPQGTVTFHRLRDYVEGDDLRQVHWRSTARTGRLMVKHNVDTSQPYTVVLLDLRPDLYTADSFEEAVDVAASVLVMAGAARAPVELRLTDGTVTGGSRLRDPGPLVDQLTGVGPEDAGDLRAQLIALRRHRGGTALVVVTGRLPGAGSAPGGDGGDASDLPYVAALRRRYDRLVVVSLDPDAGSRPRRVAAVPGVRVIVAGDAEAVAAIWNRPTTRLTTQFPTRSGER